jgi:adenine-specific DNA-methyltransferase
MLNALPPIDGYVAQHLCPRDDRDVDPSVDRLFFTRGNGQRIDAMRQTIWDWEQAGQLAPSERHFLLAALLYAVSYVSNTSGVFKGFHRGWGGATGTALYRILSNIRLIQPLTQDNRADNLVTAVDAQILAEQLPDLAPDCDIVYLDPPYNQHPYGSNYHVLNTVALWDNPPATTGIEGFGGKSAIRRDWRTARRSAYNSRISATSTLDRLLDTICSRHILISYSTDGLIPLESLVDAACQRGNTSVVTSRYKRYRVSAQRYSNRGHNVEFVLVIDARSAPNRSQGAALVDQIRRAADPEVSM